MVYFRNLARESRRWRMIHPVIAGLLAVMVAAYAGPALAAWIAWIGAA